ncbi:MAG: zf-TFIIB domain-containing protein [Planctomycetes bacterium]|nr:zf-TFIIB domain-containing protein [Planctomycetota bacterium]
MLIACPNCHRQYDVGSHAPGTTIRCFCGDRLTVETPKPRDLRMQHCSSCGSGLPVGASECEFCKGAVSLAERGGGEVCPACMARMVTSAKFCSTCGTAIRPAAVLKALVDRNCPRCGLAMTECAAENVAFTECTGCGGLWLGEDVVRQLVEDRDKSAAPAILANRNASDAAARDQVVDTRKVVYLPCPCCGTRMNRQNFARSSGVILDWCRGHGFWFDVDELQAVFRFVQAGGMERARARELEQLEQKRRDVRRLATPSHASIGGLPTPRLREAPDLIGGLAGWLASLF